MRNELQLLIRPEIAPKLSRSRSSSRTMTRGKTSQASGNCSVIRRVSGSRCWPSFVDVRRSCTTRSVWSDGARTSVTGGSGEWCTEPDGWRTGWQHEAASRVERRFREAESMARCQSGPLAGAALAAVPKSFHTRLEPHLFCCFFAVSVFLFLRLRMFADVAANSMLVASIVLHARRQDCCQDVGSQWSWQLRRSVVRRARGSLRMSWSVIWTWPFHSKPLTAEDLKSWLMGFPCLEECN